MPVKNMESIKGDNDAVATRDNEKDTQVLGGLAQAAIIEGTAVKIIPNSPEETPARPPARPPTYTLKDVARHNSPEDLWIIIDNEVYNVSSFRHEHPGGAESKPLPLQAHFPPFLMEKNLRT